MRLAIISDIHGNLVALEAVIADLRAQAPDLIVHGGDLSVIGPRPAETIDAIRELGWAGVLGNTDDILCDRASQLEREARAPKLRDWLRSVFETLTPWARARLSDEQINWLLELPREWRHKEVLLLHAVPSDLWRAPLPDATDGELTDTYGRLDATMVVYGHIHRPFVRVIDGLTVANSGSVGLPYDGDWRPSYLLVDDGVPRIRRVSYDLDRPMRDMAEAHFPLADWLAEVQRNGRFQRPG